MTNETTIHTSMRLQQIIRRSHYFIQSKRNAYITRSFRATDNAEELYITTTMIRHHHGTGRHSCLTTRLQYEIFLQSARETQKMLLLFDTLSTNHIVRMKNERVQSKQIIISIVFILCLCFFINARQYLVSYKKGISDQK